MKKIALIFYLQEDVSPEHLCLRVTQACARFYAIKEGEQVGTVDDSVRFEYADKPSYMRPV